MTIADEAVNQLIGTVIVINYKSRGAIITIDGSNLVIPLMGEGVVTESIPTVFASFKGECLGGDSTKILIRLGDGRVVAILRSSVISIRKA